MKSEQKLSWHLYTREFSHSWHKEHFTVMKATFSFQGIGKLSCPNMGHLSKGRYHFYCNQYLWKLEKRALKWTFTLDYVQVIANKAAFNELCIKINFFFM